MKSTLLKEVYTTKCIVSFHFLNLKLKRFETESEPEQQVFLMLHTLLPGNNTLSAAGCYIEVSQQQP